MAWLIPQSGDCDFDEDWAHKNPDYCDPLFWLPWPRLLCLKITGRRWWKIALRCTDHDATDSDRCPACNPPTISLASPDGRRQRCEMKPFPTRFEIYMDDDPETLAAKVSCLMPKPAT